MSKRVPKVREIKIGLVPPPLKAIGGVKGSKIKWVLFCREFHAEFNGFYLMSKFQVVFEISHQTCLKYAIFGPLNMAFSVLKWLF